MYFVSNERPPNFVLCYVNKFWYKFHPPRTTPSRAELGAKFHNFHNFYVFLQLSSKIWVPLKKLTELNLFYTKFPTKNVLCNFFLEWSIDEKKSDLTYTLIIECNYFDLVFFLFLVIWCWDGSIFEKHRMSDELNTFVALKVNFST